MNEGLTNGIIFFSAIILIGIICSRVFRHTPAPYVSSEEKNKLKRERLFEQLRLAERQHNIECRLAADGFGRDRGGDLRQYANRIAELKKELRVK